MKPKLFTISTEWKTFDLPKGMPVPRVGEVVIVDGEYIIVTKVRYYIDDGKLFHISLSGA